MLESQKAQLKSLSIETIEKAIQLQWHNKCGEIKLSLHNLVETTSLPELDSQLNKFVATDTVAALSRVGTSLYVRLQSVAMLMLALRKEAPTLALSVLEWPVASMTAFTPVVDAPIRAQLIAQSIVNMMRSNGTRVHWLLLLPASPTDNISLVMRHLKSIGLEPDEIRVASLDEQAALKRQLQYWILRQSIQKTIHAYWI
ncbi:hypothetical protein BDF19DRAFT_422719 [Syncephalis fuscata]|nr:hypothetical protein BDF19DRAFT_422719 [Syncephalis fuscata]